MTNKDYFLKDNVSVEEIGKEFFEYLKSEGIYGCNSINISNYLEKFLNSEAKPTLTEDERVILRNLKKKYKYIGKDGATLYVTELPPKKFEPRGSFDSIEELQQKTGFNLDKYNGIDKKLLLRNCVENDVAEYIYEQVKKQV